MRGQVGIRPLLGAALALGLAGCATGAPRAEPMPTGEEFTGTVTVFAAASLTDTFDRLATEFEAEHVGVEVVLNYGGSSALVAQLVEGAVADVVATANTSTMTVDDAALVIDPRPFATNVLQLVTPAGNPAGVTGLADLARTDLVVALCDPTVPCGAAAASLLELAGVAAEPDTLEQDVKAVVTKVALGEVDAALVYTTDARAAGDEVEVIAVPDADQVVNTYLIARLVGAPNPAAAEGWLALVQSTQGQKALRDAGFGAP